MTHHAWENEKAANRPVPMRYDAAYQAGHLGISYLYCTAPEIEKEQRELEKAMGLMIQLPPRNL